jgi:hypothetical protein
LAEEWSNQASLELFHRRAGFAESVFLHSFMFFNVGMKNGESRYQYEIAM